MADVLVMRPFNPAALARIEAAATVHRLWEAPDQAAFLREVGPGVQAMIGSGRVDTALMDTMPNLQLIAGSGVGYDNVDVAAATARRIVVTNTPDVLTDTVADLALALLLAVERRIVAADAFVRRSDWQRGAFPFARDVRGLRLGILGLGRIGLAIARRAEVFGMHIAYSNRRPRTDVPYPYHPDAVSLAGASDVMLLVVPGGEGSRHVVNEAVLRALGPQGTLVNIARGSVVDEPALVSALAGKRIAGAALDVFADEPRVPEALFALDNVVLTPHIASATADTRAAMGQLVLDNLESFFRDGRALTPV